MRHQWDASLNKLWCRNQIRKKRHWNSPQVVPGEPYLPPAVAYPLSMFHLTIFNSSSLTVSVVLPHHHLATLGRARLTPSTNQALFAMLAVRSIIWNNKTFSTSERLIRGLRALVISHGQMWRKKHIFCDCSLNARTRLSIKMRGHASGLHSKHLPLIHW